jgi:transposase
LGRQRVAKSRHAKSFVLTRTSCVEPIVEASCWAHSRRKFFELAKLTKAPIALEAVRRIDELFDIKREINGKPPDERKAMRQETSKPLVEALGVWLREQRARVSAKSDIGKAINYSLNRWAKAGH